MASKNYVNYFTIIQITIQFTLSLVIGVVQKPTMGSIGIILREMYKNDKV